MHGEKKSGLCQDNTGINRRGFLGLAGAAVGAGMSLPMIIPAAARGADGKAAPSNRIGVGMIGLGRQRWCTTCRSSCAAADAQVVALCDVDRWRLEHGRPRPGNSQDCFRTTDFREVLARKDVDAVMITTPDHWHVPIALAAIQAGKDVACEKPIGLCIAHGRILADAAAKAKCVFRTDSEFRSIPTWFKAVSLVRTGKIGQLKSIRTVAHLLEQAACRCSRTCPSRRSWSMTCGWAPHRGRRIPRTGSMLAKAIAGYDRPGWYGNRTYCDGGICNWGYHPLDVVQWGNNSELTGPIEIEGRGEFPPIDWLWNVILGFELRYRYANGVELFYCNTGRNTSSQVHIRFEGTEGWICAWYGPDRLEAEPKSILTAEGETGGVPVHRWRMRNATSSNCVKTRARTLGRRRSRPSLQLGGAARLHCLPGRAEADTGTRRPSDSQATTKPTGS